MDYCNDFKNRNHRPTSTEKNQNKNEATAQAVVFNKQLLNSIIQQKMKFNTNIEKSCEKNNFTNPIGNTYTKTNKVKYRSDFEREKIIQNSMTKSVEIDQNNFNKSYGHIAKNHNREELPKNSYRRESPKISQKYARSIYLFQPDNDLHKTEKSSVRF